jgi:transposase
MGRIPDEILQHRLPGTEIKQVGGRYYIQRVKCVWVPEKKKRRKVVLEFIGSVTAEGITPKKTRKVPVAATPAYSLEYGASWAAREVSGDIRECLGRHFGAHAEWMYVVALLRCIHPSAMRYIEHKYETSFLSVVSPGLDLRSESLSARMKELGHARGEMEAFMREFVPSGDWFAIFDGTSLVCHSNNIRDAQRGYNSQGCKDPQINLMYAIALKDDGIAPVFYKRYPGSIRDVSAFRNMANAMGLTTALVIADKGFTRRAECERLEREGLSYILPLRRNSLDYSRAPLQKPGRTGFEGRFRCNGHIVWFAEASNAPGSAYRCFLYLDESLGHAETLSRMTDKIGKESPEVLRKVAEKQLAFGTFVLRTNLRDHSPESVYRAYKTRDNVEQLFDMYKCEEQFATTGMHSMETQEACLFLNHLSLMTAYRLYERLKKNASLKAFAVQKTLEHLLKDIRVSRLGEASFQLEPVPKAARLALQAFGLKLPESPS